MNKITKEEYEEAIEWAKVYSTPPVCLDDAAHFDSARVLLALAAAWREVPEKFWGEERDYLGAQRMQSKAAIAARHGLPVEGVKE